MVCETGSFWMQRICRKEKGSCDWLKIFVVDFPAVLSLLNFSTSLLSLIKISNYWALNLQIVRSSTFHRDEEIVLSLWFYCRGENIPHFSTNPQTTYMHKLVFWPLSLLCLLCGGCNQHSPECFALLDLGSDPQMAGNVETARSCWWSIWWLDRAGSARADLQVLVSFRILVSWKLHVN